MPHTTTPAEVGQAYRAAVLAARAARPETLPAVRLSAQLAGLAARELAAGRA